jgi:hypothetical protein|tara:strand:- start:57 stop:212 length:156 start_codon:yes stop_codon:yes gene_type:complete
MTFLEGIQMAIILNAITFFLISVIFFFIRQHLKSEEKQEEASKVDSPLKGL